MKHMAENYYAWGWLVLPLALSGLVITFCSPYPKLRRFASVIGAGLIGFVGLCFFILKHDLK